MEKKAELIKRHIQDELHTQSELFRQIQDIEELTSETKARFLISSVRHNVECVKTWLNAILDDHPYV